MLGVAVGFKIFMKEYLFKPVVRRAMLYLFSDRSFRGFALSRSTSNSLSQGIYVFAALGVLLIGLTARPSRAETTCSMRADLASNSGVSWADLRAACEADQTAYKKKDPVGYNWFINAGNGFSGFP